MGEFEAKRENRNPTGEGIIEELGSSTVELLQGAIQSEERVASNEELWKRLRCFRVTRTSPRPPGSNFPCTRQGVSPKAIAHFEVQMRLRSPRWEGARPAEATRGDQTNSHPKYKTTVQDNADTAWDRGAVSGSLRSGS